MLKTLGVLALILFFVWLVAVLQGWSNNTVSGRCIGVVFLIAMALAARWGARVLGLIH